MADECDRSEYFIESRIDDGIAAAMMAARNIPEGMGGECDFCGYEFSRLVDGACGHCRDKYRLD